jgi:hypothetical protein
MKKCPNVGWNWACTWTGGWQRSWGGRSTTLFAITQKWRHAVLGFFLHKSDVKLNKMPASWLTWQMSGRNTRKSRWGVQQLLASNQALTHYEALGKFKWCYGILGRSNENQWFTKLHFLRQFFRRLKVSTVVTLWKSDSLLLRSCNERQIVPNEV